MATAGPSQPPENINGLRLFERPMEAEAGRIVYQGKERPNAVRGTAHDYWIVEKQAPREWRLVRAVATFNRGSGYQRHDEEVLGTFQTDLAGVEAISDHAVESPTGGVPRSQSVTRALYDGSVRFMPPFSKSEAVYRPTSDPDFQSSHDRCGDCVHYIDGGACHFVQGDINPAAYCEEYYADYGVFAHDHDDYVEVNAELIGDKWDLDEAAIADLVDEIEERAQQRLRTRRGG